MNREIFVNDVKQSKQNYRTLSKLHKIRPRSACCPYTKLLPDLISITSTSYTIRLKKWLELEIGSDKI